VHKGDRALLAGLGRGRLSRNRHFALLSRPEGRRARRIHRLLLALGRDLRAPDATARIEAVGGVAGLFTLTVDRPRLSFRRVTYLEGEEVDLLCENLWVRERLRRA
jgi:hypothetical protein